MRRFRTSLTLGLLLLTLLGGVMVSPVSAAAQGSSAAAKGCQQGGYASKVRGDGPRKGEGFQNVGECVSYVARGGTLSSRGGLGSSDPCAAPRSYNPDTRTPSLANLNLGSCDLSNLNLSGADLSYSALIDGILPEANLTGANLTGTNLSGANLNSTILVKATLFQANLSYADLTGAKLTGATEYGDVIWESTTCPDGTDSEDHADTCIGHF